MLSDSGRWSAFRTSKQPGAMIPSCITESFRDESHILQPPLDGAHRVNWHCHWCPNDSASCVLDTKYKSAHRVWPDDMAQVVTYAKIKGAPVAFMVIRRT